jgi:hypothetical protein
VLNESSGYLDLLPCFADKMHAGAIVQERQRVVPTAQVRRSAGPCSHHAAVTMQLRVRAGAPPATSPCFGGNSLQHRFLHLAAVRCARCMDEQTLANVHQMRAEERNAQADFMRLRGARVRDRVVRPGGSRAAAHVPERTCGHLNAKLQPLLLGTGLNGARRVAEDVFAAASTRRLDLRLLRCSYSGALAAAAASPWGRTQSCGLSTRQLSARGRCAPRAARDSGGTFCLPRRAFYQLAGVGAGTCQQAMARLLVHTDAEVHVERLLQML